ncbi:BPSS1780 family membrane protein [Undibacterium sp. Ji50W]|uniref:BPSS1780 family membrane protein n=1 Tax=Undibacterium sp. Ji50W TaxID=3413041 RepID=UPI003BF14171
MNAVDAASGWGWVKQGFTLFGKQPAEMLTLFFAYMFLSLVIGFIPFAGRFLPLMLVPVFAMSFMQACSQIEDDKRVYPNLLLTGFRSEGLLRLLSLGVLYVLAAMSAIGLSSLADDGIFLNFIFAMTPEDPETLPKGKLFLGMLVAGLAYLPAMMAFWFAAPLITWGRMSVGKAVFYSFFAVQRTGLAFTVYGLAWLLIGVFGPTLLGMITAAVVGQVAIGLLVMIPVSLVLTVVMYCSFYPTYTTIFGRPDIPRSETPQNPEMPPG